MTELLTGPGMMQVARNAFSFVFQGSLHLNLLRGNIPKKNILFPASMAQGRLLDRGRERGALAFKLGDNCLDELLAIPLPGAFPAFGLGIGFSGVLNAMVMMPESHS